jgi:hypothetical protein
MMRSAMERWPKQPAWHAYFTENMEALGLDVPKSWYGKGTQIVATLAALVALSEKFGSRVTIGELLSAGTKGELLLVAGSGYASWYLGAAVGSAAVASGRYIGCGTQMIDILGYAGRNQLLTPAITRRLMVHSEIYDSSKKNRRHYGLWGQSLT